MCSLWHGGTSGKLRAATVRPTSVYGVAQPVENSKWFGIVQQICQGQDVNVTGGSKTVHASDVVKAIRLLLDQDDSITGQTYNCCDRMISDHQVACIAKRIANSDSVITGQPKVAKHKIETGKIEALGMRFGGDRLLEQTIADLVTAIRQTDS